MNVYDFDNTIYAGESCFHLFLYFLKKKPSLVLLLPKVAVAFAKYKKGKVTVEDFLKQYAPKVGEMFRSIPDIEKEMVHFWDAHMKNIKPFYSEKRKADDLIITASPDFSVKEVCKRLGIKNFLATRVDPESGEILHFNLREMKIKAFFEEYPGCEIEEFYTDSPENDKPLIDISKRAFVVRKNKITRIK